jgi:hypothetical protein
LQQQSDVGPGENQEKHEWKGHGWAKQLSSWCPLLRQLHLLPSDQKVPVPGSKHSAKARTKLHGDEELLREVPRSTSACDLKQFFNCTIEFQLLEHVLYFTNLMRHLHHHHHEHDSVKNPRCVCELKKDQ